MGNAVTALALSAGDPSGIGPEIAIAAFMAREAAALPPFYLLADPALIASRA
ncbi:4-hydroxythreonine-4-phosphate dehydrogenase, partial [Mesorhizobium sp. M7A.F.Ca.CA.002.03.2.1]